MLYNMSTAVDAQGLLAAHHNPSATEGAAAWATCDLVAATQARHPPPCIIKCPAVLQEDPAVQLAMFLFDPSQFRSGPWRPHGVAGARSSALLGQPLKRHAALPVTAHPFSRS